MMVQLQQGELHATLHLKAWQFFGAKTAIMVPADPVS